MESAIIEVNTYYKKCDNKAVTKLIAMNSHV